MVAQAVDVDAEVVGDLVIRQTFKNGADWRARHQVARVQRERRVGRGSFPLKQCGQVRDASYAIGIGQQAVVQIVEVQDRELVDGTLPAAGQQRRRAEATKNVRRVRSKFNYPSDYRASAAGQSITMWIGSVAPAFAVATGSRIRNFCPSPVTAQE